MDEYVILKLDDDICAILRRIPAAEEYSRDSGYVTVAEHFIVYLDGIAFDRAQEVAEALNAKR